MSRLGKWWTSARWFRVISCGSDDSLRWATGNPSFLTSGLHTHTHTHTHTLTHTHTRRTGSFVKLVKRGCVCTTNDNHFRSLYLPIGRPHTPITLAIQSSTIGAILFYPQMNLFLFFFFFFLSIYLFIFWFWNKKKKSVLKLTSFLVSRHRCPGIPWRKDCCQFSTG